MGLNGISLGGGYIVHVMYYLCSLCYFWSYDIKNINIQEEGIMHSDDMTDEGTFLKLQGDVAFGPV
uniref:Uncharacterized protein n=1 Tax=Anguilla anguilla TaxID=7936 RepID=A0A0E9SR38_ANGAN